MQIPRYQQQTELSPLPNSRVQAPTDPNAYGANIGQVMQASGEQLYNKYTAEQEKQDAIGVINADNSLTAAMSDVMYNKDTGLMHRTSMKANGISKEFEDTWTKVLGEHTKNLNQKQMPIFLQRAGTLKNSLFTAVNNYEVGQREVALSESVDAAVGLTADAVSQSGVWMNPVFVKGEIANMDRKIMFMYKDSPPEYVKQKQSEAHKTVYSKMITNLIDSNNYKDVEKALELHGEQIDSTLKVKAEEWAHGKKVTFEADNNALLALKEGNWDLTNSLEIGKKSCFKKVTRKSAGSADQGLISKWVTGAIDKVDPVFLTRLAKLAEANGKQIDVGDGFRTYDEQAALFANSDGSGKMVASPGNSRHEVAFAVDINSQWVKDMSTEELEKFGLHKPMDYEDWHVEPAETRGKQTGELKDISLGGGTTTTEEFDEEAWRALEPQIRAKYSDHEREKAKAEAESLKALKNALATASSDSDRLNIIENANVEPYIKADLRNSILKEQDKEKSKYAKGSLEILKAQGKLTESDVNAVKGLLNYEDYIHYRSIAIGGGISEAEKANDEADRDWHSWVDSLYPNDANKRNGMISDMKQWLDGEGVNGQDRKLRARQLLDMETKNPGTVLGYGSANAGRFNRIDATYPVNKGQRRVSELILIGDKGADADAWTTILGQISGVCKEDPYAQKAWDMIINNGLPLTEKNFWDLRNEVARLDGHI